jgi:mannose-6-phosphate isomerase
MHDHINKCEKIEKPWGYEVLWANTENYVAKVMHINSDHRMSLQYHEKKEETIYVMSGKLRIWNSEDDSKYTDMESGSIYHVTPGNVHRFGSATKKYGTLLMEVSTNHLDDVIRLSDDYKR